MAVSRGEFFIGGALTFVGVLLLRWPASIWPAQAATPLPQGRRRLALLAVCAVAVLLRAYHLEPPGLWGDDALNGLFAFDILDGRIRSPFELVHHSHSYFHALSNYPIAAAFWAFGAGPATLRLPSVVANALAMPLLYGTIAPLLGARVALTAGLFFACSPMQLAHARSLIQMNLSELFQLAGLCLLVRGVTGKRRWLIAASGAPLALCLYTYHSAKIAPLVAVPYFLAAVLIPSLKRVPGSRPSVWWGPASLVVFLACALPFVSSWIESSELLTGRIEGTSIWSAVRVEGWRVLWDSLWRTLLVFHYQQGPQYHWFGLGYEPAFDWVVAFLFLPALAASLARWREPGHVLLLGWIVLGMLPGVLSSEAPRAYRVLLATPPLYALAAWTVVRIDDFARTLIRRSARIPLRATAFALLASVPLIDFNWYFFHTLTHPVFHYYQGERIVKMARGLRRQGPGWIGYVLSDTFDANHECLRFLARCWALKMRTIASLGDVLPVRGVDRGALFMMTGATVGAAKALSAWYPEQRIDVRHDSRLRNSFLDGWLLSRPHTPSLSNAFFAVSRDSAESKRGVRATFLSGQGAVLATRIEAQPWLRGAADLPAAPGEIRTVRWSAALVAEREGTHRFLLQDGAGARLSVDGVEIGARGAAGDVGLAAGPHLLEVEAEPAAQPLLRVLWQPPGRPLGELPPDMLFQHPEAGLISDRVVYGQRLRGFEPYPYYAFFADSFPPSSQLTWFGRLRVPEGGLRLRIDASGSRELKLGGRVWSENQSVPPGVHDFELRLTNVPRRLILKLEWRRADGTIDPLPAEAFTPPPSPAVGS